MQQIVLVFPAFILSCNYQDKSPSLNVVLQTPVQ
jgi:hypothetical protein